MGGGLWNTFGELGVGALVATQKGRRAGCQPRRPWTWGQTVQSERLLLPETPETLSNSKGALLWPFGAKAESSEDSPSFLLGQGCGEWAQNRLRTGGGSTGLGVRLLVLTASLVHQVALGKPFTCQSASVSSSD